MIIGYWHQRWFIFMKNKDGDKNTSLDQNKLIVVHRFVPTAWRGRRKLTNTFKQLNTHD
jgi:hypothetical protein